MTVGPYWDLDLDFSGVMFWQLSKNRQIQYFSRLSIGSPKLLRLGWSVQLSAHLSRLYEILGRDLVQYFLTGSFWQLRKCEHFKDVDTSVEYQSQSISNFFVGTTNITNYTQPYNICHENSIDGKISSFLQYSMSSKQARVSKPITLTKIIAILALMYLLIHIEFYQLLRRLCNCSHPYNCF